MGPRGFPLPVLCVVFSFPAELKMDDFRWEAPRRGQTWGKDWGGELFSVEAGLSKTGLFRQPSIEGRCSFLTVFL